MGFGLIAVLAACAIWLWTRPKGPPPSTAAEAYSAVTGTDPAKLTEAERAEWAATVGSVLDRLPPQEFDALAKKVVLDDACRGNLRAANPEDRRKLFGKMTDDQKADLILQRVEALKQMTPEERKAYFEKERGFGFGPGGPGAGGPGSGPGASGGSGGASQAQPTGDSQGQKGVREAQTAQRVAQRIASRTPTQRAEFRQAMAALRQMRQQAGVSGRPP